MPDAIDGRFNDPDGRSKVFVRRRNDETGDEFAARAMGILFIMSDITPLERVVMSVMGDWEKLPSNRWLEARHRSYPNIHLRVTILQSNGGGSVGHLVVDHDDQQVADGWADRQDGGVYLPRVEDGRVSKWQGNLWQLSHEVWGMGMGDLYDTALANSGVIVERGWL